MTISDDSIITLISSDGVKVEIPVAAARESKMISSTFNLDDEEDQDDDVVLEMQTPNVDGTTLKKVVEFLLHFKDHPFPKMPEINLGKTFEQNIKGQWYTDYMKELCGDYKDDMDLLYSVKSAANYLDIERLLEMLCLWMTFKVEEVKTPEAIRALLRLPRMTEEEEKQAREEHPWMFMDEDN